jgi:ABC-type branched-subunit amino acid transport system ATPase component/predicted MFS family arabinose efflux permease
VSTSLWSRFWFGVRHPGRWLRAVCGGEAVFPIVVLFGLNAVDEFDRAAFGILLPEIRDHFDLDFSTMLGLVGLASVAALALQVPIAQIADRRKRVPLAVAGALVWALFSGLTGFATGLIVLTIARSGSALGKAVIDPTHNSLISDYYPIEVRTKVFSVHRAANAVGAFLGPLSAGLLAFYFGWRTPFVVFMVPTVIFAVLAMKLHEPIRGRWERQATGASDEVALTEEVAPSFSESWRTVHKVQSLRRIWYSLPFLATGLIGFVTLASLLYDQEFGLDERARGVAAAIAEPFQLVGLVLGARFIAKRYAGNVAGLARVGANIAIAAAVLAGAFALAPNIVVAVAINCVISAALAVLAPAIFSALSLAIPPRARATGFSVASLWIIPGLGVLPIIGWIADQFSIRVGMLVMIPLFLVGGLIQRTIGNVIVDDIAQVWQSAAARSESLYERRQGRSKLLVLRGVRSGYDGVEILHGIDLDLDEGEIIALLGTNGAGKSTLLKTISGVVEADRGAVIFDGRDITHAPPHEIAAFGIVQMPGGAGVFGSLTVAENLELAGWTQRRDVDSVRAARAEVLDIFPVLAQRLDQPAANLSGGQQQMLALGMSFVMRPRVLLIDELSLGLAPVVVGQMLPIVKRMSQEGVTVVLVEQSVNVALTVAERAYFLERGEVRFSGPTAELLERPDVLRSVFLSGASVGGTSAPMPVDVGDEVVLATRDVVTSFGGICAVDGVSLDVHAREIIGVIGPNGAGKTTLFDVISGFAPLFAGSVHVGGVDVSSASPNGRARAGLGRSFQDARLFPELTVAETLAVSLERWVGNRSALAASMYLPPVFDSEQEIRSRVAELIELLGLGDFERKFVRELSTGTRRIVDIACLVAHRPTVIMLDEPTSGLAQREVEALAPVVRRLRDEMGAALLVVEHDISFVSSVADRLVAMDQGRVVTSGPPAEVLAHPQVVESYLGTSSAAIARSGQGG